MRVLHYLKSGGGDFSGGFFDYDDDGDQRSGVNEL